MMEALAVLLLVVSSSAVAFQSMSTCHPTISHHQHHQIMSTSARKISFLRSLSSATAAAKAVSAAVIKDAEARATVAIETWSIEVTPFMEPSDADIIESMFMKRGDVTVLRIVGGQRRPSPMVDVSLGSSSITKVGSTKPNLKLNECYTQLLSRDEIETQSDPSKIYGRRSRFVITNPDLGLDINTAENQYTNMICMNNVDAKSCSQTFPDTLASIGVHLDNIGDIVITNNNDEGGTVYIIVDPSVVSRCIRLLSKELTGVGISLSLCEQNECMPHGSIVQDMKLNKTTERQIGRKKYEDGYVRF